MDSALKEKDREREKENADRNREREKEKEKEKEREGDVEAALYACTCSCKVHCDKGVVENVKVEYNSILEDELPQLSALEITVIASKKALDELPGFMQSRHERSRNKPISFLHEQGPYTPSSAVPLTALQKFKQKTSYIQRTLVKKYLTVLNTATKEELLQLKGIGPKRAAHVLELRQQCLDPFKDLQDLKDIGVGQRDLISEFAKTIM